MHSLIKLDSFCGHPKIERGIGWKLRHASHAVNICVYEPPVATGSVETAQASNASPLQTNYTWCAFGALDDKTRRTPRQKHSAVATQIGDGTHGRIFCFRSLISSLIYWIFCARG
jgi:hypothetical protein